MPYKFKGRPFDWQTVTASGWGTTEAISGPMSVILRKVDLQVVPLDACQHWPRPHKPHDFDVTDNNICAYGMPMSTSGVCSGDSGKLKKRPLESR